MELQNEGKNNSMNGNRKKHNRHKTVRRRENMEERKKNGKTKKIRTEESN
jgi:hypothetical protein